ncbi:hypothetical protein Dimus_003133, partial [Dionaea muscipula]
DDRELELEDLKPFAFRVSLPQLQRWTCFSIENQRNPCKQLEGEEDVPATKYPSEYPAGVTDLGADYQWAHDMPIL